jgi:hypothetical protein
VGCPWRPSYYGCGGRDSARETWHGDGEAATACQQCQEGCQCHLHPAHWQAFNPKHLHILPVLHLYLPPLPLSTQLRNG